MQAGGSVSALHASSNHLAAGLTSGHAAVIDDRSGAVVAFWKGHDAAITALASIDAHHLLTASQVSIVCDDDDDDDDVDTISHDVKLCTWVTACTEPGCCLCCSCPSFCNESLSASLSS